ncbi:MAG: hypothetical protein WC967_14795 [Balneolaceae bacterium]
MKELKGYRGNKAFPKQYMEIINIMPPHYNYIELCCGSSGVYRHKKLSDESLLVDIDKEVIDILKKQNYPKTRLSRQNAIRTLQLITVPFYNEPTLIYLDPPYPKNSRSEQKDIYKYEMTDQQHIELLKELNRVSELGVMIVISTYDNPIYQEHLKGWNKHSYKTSIHGKVKIETLYFNYPLPTELHDYRYLGKDCWDRQRINRKVSRKVASILKMPDLERKKFLQELNEQILQSKTTVRTKQTKTTVLKEKYRGDNKAQDKIMLRQQKKNSTVLETLEEIEKEKSNRAIKDKNN